MSYVDGFVVAVPTANRESYRAMAAKVAGSLVACGATQVLEGWSDDVPHGQQTDFYRAVQATEEEGVVFAWVTWPSKAVRDEAWKKVMADPAMQPEEARRIFDGKRMIYGGFATLVDERARA